MVSTCCNTNENVGISLPFTKTIENISDLSHSDESWSVLPVNRNKRRKSLASEYYTDHTTDVSIETYEKYDSNDENIVSGSIITPPISYDSDNSLDTNEYDEDDEDYDDDFEDEEVVNELIRGISKLRECIDSYRLERKQLQSKRIRLSSNTNHHLLNANRMKVNLPMPVMISFNHVKNVINVQA